MHRYEFASDNTAGMAPEALAALVEANSGFCASYGEDIYTRRAVDAFRELFGLPCEVFFVSTGTAANSLALSQLCRSHHAIICHEFAHIETDECGAPEFFNNGVKLLTTSGDNCKISPEAVRHLATNRTDVHFSRARALSLTLPTEAGTVYTLDELVALREAARENKLSIHLDGARFTNAVASLGCPPRDIIEASGADVLCFGGTKGGFGLTEAVLFFNRELAEEFDYRCKQAGQLPSKMRLLSAPWATMLTDNHWLHYAQLTNNAAQRLEKIFLANGLQAMFPVQANAVFVNLPLEVSTKLQEQGWHFYSFFETASRFMCSWNVGPDVLDAFERDLKAALFESVV
ncbi:low specificity L-threonine aldolase [bacterium]|nr:MAG: low specificity L-threonine aldolase [bacterium]